MYIIGNTPAGFQTAEDVRAGRITETSISHMNVTDPEIGAEFIVPIEVGLTRKGVRNGCKILGAYYGSEIDKMREERANLKNVIYIPTSSAPTAPVQETPSVDMSAAQQGKKVVK